MRKTGFYQYFGSAEHFIPYPLPPKNPPFSMNQELTELYGEAMLNLGKLNEMAASIPDNNRFVKSYVLKEALLSSEIEGIHTTMLDVFTQPLFSSKITKNTQLVVNYTKALDVAVHMIKNEGFPITNRVILQAHKLLLEIGPGQNANPGNFRQQSVRVGNLVPAPAPQIPRLMQELEIYINTDQELPTLIKAGLAHVQFETIHPFLDGNGRIGRMLILLIMLENNLLQQPVLYPSYYFKKNHLEYYFLLDRVRTHGDFEAWIKFYLEAIKESSIDAYIRAKKIEQLKQDLILYLKEKARAKMQESLLLALDIIFANPVISVKQLASQLAITYNTANNIIQLFIEFSILVAQTEKKRDRLFVFQKYLTILSD